MLLIYSNYFYASEIFNNSINPLYFGVGGGYGSTTWAQLVPRLENQNFAMKLSAPIEVTEGGGVYNGVIGFEFARTFAIEANYIHFPAVTINFDSSSLFSFLNDGETSFTTETETINLMAKLMVVLPNERIRIFSGVGVAGLHRRDIMINHWLLNPAFNAGINYQLDNHFLIEFHANITAGYGESQLNPTEVYFPFIYATMIRLIYYI